MDDQDAGALLMSCRNAMLGLLLLVLAQRPCHAQIVWLWDEARLPAWSAPEAAVLQRHILLSGNRILTRPRMRQAALARHTLVTPVVHVEISTVNPPYDMEASRMAIMGAMRQAAGLSTSGRVQLDMEARPSQRAFYRSLVAELRATLPASIKLSVTALAWWCRAPQWLDGLEADEVVPMFFRMGRDSTAMREILASSPGKLHPRCRDGSAGFSPQEAVPTEVSARYARTYWFDYRAWKAEGTAGP